MSKPSSNKEILNNIVTQYGLTISYDCRNQGTEYNALWEGTYIMFTHDGGAAVIGSATGRTKDIAKEAAAGNAVAWLRARHY
jgi:hypothetical protein